MSLYPRNNVRKIAPGPNWTPAGTDAAWRLVGGIGEPDFEPQPGITTAWANATGGVPLQFRIDGDGMVHIQGVIDKPDQPLGDFGSKVIIMPVGYRPAQKWVDSSQQWAVWHATAPTGIDADLQGAFVWQGRSVPGIPVTPVSVDLTYLADG